jgi:hypothetical protein
MKSWEFQVAKKTPKFRLLSQEADADRPLSFTDVVN